MNTLLYMTFSNTLLLQYLMLPLVHPKPLHIPMQQEEQHWPKLEKKEVGPSVGGNTKSHFYYQPLISNVTNTTSWHFHCRKKCVRRQKTTDASIHHSNIDILSKIRKRRETSADITVVRKESGSSSILQTDIARWFIEMFNYSLSI